jgi:cytochrome c oxidase subunit 2
MNLQSAIRNPMIRIPMSRLLAIIIWLIAIAAIGFVAWSGWRLPEAVSKHSDLIDAQLKVTSGVIGIGFFLAQAALGLAIWRRRRKAQYSTGNAGIEVALTLLTAVIFIALAVSGQRVWAQLKLNRPPRDAVRVEVVAQQFAWNFRYPGDDGRFGSVDPRLYNDADNTIGARPGPLGIDPRDPAGVDDIVARTLVVPVSRPVNLILRAKDVTHDFYVPALRLKHDAVPGMKIDIHFTALKEGRYEIACAELCGQLHHQMRAILEVKSQAEYAEWMEERSRDKRK